MFKVEFQDIDKFLKSEIKIDLPIGKFAGIIADGITENLKIPKSYDNSRLAPLKKNAYYKRKVKAGRTKIFDGLSNSNKLRDSVKVKKISDKEAEVFIANTNKENGATNNEVMYYLQEGGGSLAGPRKAFGITEKSLKEIEKEINKINIKIS